MPRLSPTAFIQEVRKAPCFHPHRMELAWRVGMSICVLGFVFSLGTVFYEFSRGQRLTVAIDAILTLGCLLSYLLSQARRQSRIFVWWPIYSAIWLNSSILIYLTGGMRSLYLDEVIILLFSAGVTLQLRFTIQAVTLFVFCNYLFWLGLSVAIPISQEIGIGSGFLTHREYLYMIITLIILERFFASEEKLAGESVQKDHDLEEAHDRLTHASRMAEIGTLVASAGHELSQPVQTISMSSALLSRLIQNPQNNAQPIGELLTHIKDATSRLSRILVSFKEFSYKDTFKQEKFDLSQAIEKIKTLTEFDLRGKRIAFQVSTPATPLWIQGDLSRIEQILINLINNARDACLKSDHPFVKIKAIEFQNWIRIEISNSGPAIPLHVQARLFERFFTTKEKGKGTGLGLTICLDLIKRHNGRIWFCSEDELTTFVVDLPISSEPAAATKIQVG